MKSPIYTSKGSLSLAASLIAHFAQLNEDGTGTMEVTLLATCVDG